METISMKVCNCSCKPRPEDRSIQEHTFKVSIGPNPRIPNEKPSHLDRVSLFDSNIPFSLRNIGYHLVTSDVRINEGATLLLSEEEQELGFKVINADFNEQEGR